MDERASPANQSDGGGGVYRLAELSYSRLDQFERERTVVIFSVSPLEEHGTHLPVGTDLFEAEFFSDELARRITEAKSGWSVLLGPPLPIGSSAFDHAGTLLVRPRIVRDAVEGYGAALARHGFRYILVMNAHAGPRHLVALDEASAAVSRRYKVRMLSLSGLVLWRFLRGKYAHDLQALLQRPLTVEEQEAMRGDAHGGLWETSLLLRIRPSLVGEEYRRLPPQRYSLLQALRKNYPLRLGNCQGYIGSPAAADTAWGEVARRLLVDAAWEFAAPMLNPSNGDWRRRSVLSKIPLLRSDLPYVVGIGLFGAAMMGVGLVARGVLFASTMRRRREQGRGRNEPA
jgi:creatinine amidohydrolase